MPNTKNRGMSVKHYSLDLETLHAPEQAVWSGLMVKPPLQLLHMAAPCLVQAAPVFGEPFEQLHMLAAQDNVERKQAASVNAGV